MVGKYKIQSDFLNVINIATSLTKHERDEIITTFWIPDGSYEIRVCRPSPRLCRTFLGIRSLAFSDILQEGSIFKTF